MKNYIHLVIPLIMVICLVSPADANWLQRGLDAFKGQNEVADETDLSKSEITLGLKEALKVGSENVISRLGRENGYYENPRAHIPLPDSLQKIQTVLEKSGLGQMLTDLELRMNRAAEKATPKAKDMFIDAISQMTLTDAQNILQGPDDAATRYFQDKMSQPLEKEFSPIVQQSLSESGAVQTYDNMMGDYRNIPFVPDVNADLTSHVVDYSLMAIFDYLAEEEAGIRNNPVQRTTDILRKVFGNR
ncbi:DUF4197 domain-containing protein [Desulfonatronovibrio magnus]|uniref:DUF4197 domain-containing protein n=1 Tax=Desulfonatronovibrio magnus TaxID=698827 RepID=UPI0005EB9BAA|nr:DUF4197 domain-containing protein [Desulfonatronovibrio magnus]